MRLIATSAMMFSLALLAACTAPRQEEPTAPPVTTQGFQDVRTAYQKNHPDVLVGLVVAALQDGRMVGVGEIDAKALKVRDALTFADSQGRSLANGRVLVITDTAIHVLVDQVLPEGRFPVAGDLAIKLP